MIDELYEHQREAAIFLINKKHACLFHEVGVGKTNSAIYAVDNLPKGTLLIAAPACVIQGMWRLYDDLPIIHDVEFLSYEFISRHWHEFANRHYDYVIADECHKLKNPKSKVSKSFRMLTKHSKYVWGLTGTPYATSFLDVYSIFWSLNIPAFDETYDEFMHRVYVCEALYIAVNKFIYRPVKLKDGVLDLLVSKISDWASVIKAEDCISLPGLVTKEVLIPDMRTPAFDDCIKSIVHYDDHDATLNKLAIVQKLHQLSNGFIYDDTKHAKVVKPNLKLDKCKEIIEMELEERDRLIIIYEYEYDKQQLESLIASLNISYTDKIEEFSSTQILLLQEQRAVGINLQQYASCMIFFTFSYSYLQYTQAVGRIYRSGQKQPCILYILINDKTAEPKIWNAVSKALDMDTLFKNLCVGD